MNLPSLVHRLDSTIFQKLFKYGYCVIDNALFEQLANNILSEIKPLHEFDILYPCHTHINTKDETHLISKSNVWELELHSCPELQSICTDLWSVLHDKSLCNVLNANNTNYEYTHQTLKILFSSNNGCFPIHFDSDPIIDLRRITAVLYLNEEDINGGEIRLYPLLSPQCLQFVRQHVVENNKELNHCHIEYYCNEPNSLCLEKYNDSGIDVILMAFVIHHISAESGDRDSILLEVFKSCKVGGIFAVFELGPDFIKEMESKHGSHKMQDEHEPLNKKSNMDGFRTSDEIQEYVEGFGCKFVEKIMEDTFGENYWILLFTKPSQ